MFNSTEEANTRYARAAGRIVFGVVLILGAATFVERMLRMGQPAAAKTLMVIWLAAFFAGWLFSQLAACTKRHIEIEDIFTASWVVPAIGVALVLPLTLHIPVAIAVGVDMKAFDDWARLSLIITGPAHLAFAFLAALRAGQLAKGRPAISTARIYIATLVVSSIPFALIMFIPPLLVGLTGFAILPLLQRMRTLIERERGTYELPHRDRGRMKKRATKKRRPARQDGEKKSDATRRLLLERALALFQEHGVEATTMRDIARAANLSLGAAYYYFPSKEALIFAYYEQNQHAMEDIAARARGTLRERLGVLMHGKLEAIRPQRAMLGAIVARLVDPGDPVGAFSAQTRAVRERAIQIFAETLAAGGIPAPAVEVAAPALWLVQMAAMLVFVNDTSAKSARTHGLVDDGLDLLVPLLPLLATPAGRAICERVTSALARAGLALGPQTS